MFEWDLEFGGQLKFFNSLKSRGKRTPLDEIPSNDFSYEWYYKAYSTLRYSKGDNGFIPLSEILSYTDHFKLIGSKDEFLDVIRGLDVAENKFFKKKEDAKQ